MKKYTRLEMKAIMEVKGYSPNTIKHYLVNISNLAAYFNLPPHKLSPEHIHKYQVYLVQEKQISWSYFNQAVCSMRFFLNMLLAITGLLNIFLFRKSIRNFLLFFHGQKSNHSFL